MARIIIVIEDVDETVHVHVEPKPPFETPSPAQIIGEGIVEALEDM